MQYLERTTQADEAIYYRICGDYEDPVDRYLVTTPETRAICNHPEMVGWDFSDGLGRAVRRALQAAPFSNEIRALPEHRVCVLNFLRGGLNFGVRKALHEAYGLNNHASAFMSSQRYRSEDGRWGVREDMYRKLKIAPDSVLVMGDVVATGVTMANGLNVLLDHLERIGSPIRMLVFFTIGCHKVEKALAGFHERASNLFPDYERTVVVYFEGKFKLVDSKTELSIAIPGTDLIRRQALLTPEFEKSQYERPENLLERCVIYDAGSRSFDVPHYVEDVMDYWSKTERLGKQGTRLDHLLSERWPDVSNRDRSTFVASRKRTWQNLDESEIEEIHSSMENMLGGLAAQDAPALADMARSRLRVLGDLAAR